MPLPHHAAPHALADPAHRRPFPIWPSEPYFHLQNLATIQFCRYNQSVAQADIIIADDKLLPQAIEYMGASQILYASDFPHWDHSYPKSLKELADRPDVSDDDKRKIFSENPRRRSPSAPSCSRASRPTAGCTCPRHGQASISLP